MLLTPQPMRREARLWEGATGQRGEPARIEDLAAVLGKQRARATLGGTFENAPFERVDASQAGGQVELVLPPCGEVAVKVRGAHQAWAGRTRVTLQLAERRSAWADRAAQTLPLDGGAARFSPVGLGLVLEVSVDTGFPGKSPTRTFTGPTRPGERVDVTIELEPGGLTELCGTVVTPSHAPLAGRAMRYAIVQWGTAERLAARLTTDAEGRFAIWIETPPKDAGEPALVIATDGGDARWARLLLARPVAEGRVDLGRIYLGEMPLLCAGRVIDDRGEPVEGATVGVLPRTAAQRNESVSFGRSIPDWVTASTRTAGDGLFVLEGPIDTSLVGVFVGAPDHWQIDDRKVERGATNVELRLTRVGSIAGQLHTGVGVPLDEVEVHAEVRDAPVFGSGAYATPAPDGTFELRGLHPGLATVTISLLGEPLSKTIEVPVRPGEVTRDARLQAVDLSRVAGLAIRVLDRDGKTIDETHVAVLGDGDTARAFVLPHGEHRLAFPTWPHELLVYAKGYRIRRIANPPAELTVTLQPAIEVELRVPEATISACTPLELHASVEPTARTGGATEYVLHRIGGGTGAGRGAPWRAWSSATFVAPGTARLTVGEPGEHAVQCSVVQRTPSGSSSTDVAGATRIRVGDGPGVQRFDVRVDLEALRVAVEKQRNQR